MFTARSQ